MAQNTQNAPANNTSIFGQPKPAGSLFGNNQQQPAASSSVLANAPPLGTTTQPSTGLFGGFGQQNQQQQPTTNLFGQSTQQPQQQQPSTGLFSQSTQQQPQAGGLFGQNNPQQQQSSNIFGQPGQQQQPQPQTSLFGGSSLFNSTNNQTANKPSLFTGFGSTNTQQQQPQQQSNLFGPSNTGTNALQAQATLPSFGGGGGFGSTGSSIFGNAQQPQPQQQAFSNSTQQSGLLLTKSTKFNDLPEDTKKLLENLDTHIQGRIQISKELHQRKLGEEPTKGQELIRSLHKEYVHSATKIRNDLHYTQDLKAKVDQAVEDTIVATRIVDGFKNPQSGNTYLKDHAGFPLEFFTRVADQMRERLAWYKSTIEQIERKLSTSANQSQTPQAISATLQAQYTTFLALASKTATLNTELQKIKVLYTQLWRSKTGSVRDPFNDLDKVADERSNDFGMSGLNFN